MPITANITRALTDRMPKVISPGVHAIIDYATAGAFIAMGIFFWRRGGVAHKRAAISSLACGATELVTAAFTDYPGGISKQMSFAAHGRVDVGMAGMVSAMPGIMKFDDHASARFFTMQGITLAAVTGLTDFTGSGRPGQLKRLEEEEEAA